VDTQDALWLLFSVMFIGIVIVGFSTGEFTHFLEYVLSLVLIFVSFVLIHDVFSDHALGESWMEDT
jgi:hypothetical protein